jgi:Domain of unknown function (DUF4329)
MASGKPSSRKAVPATIEQIARRALNGILGQSIEERREYGAMIYRQLGVYLAMPPRTQGDPNTVDVGTHEPNCGCPSNATPVAYYHTHVVAKFSGEKGDYNEMSPEDKGVAKGSDIDAYLGTLDGSFFVYDHKADKVLRLSGKLDNVSKDMSYRPKGILK